MAEKSTVTLLCQLQVQQPQQPILASDTQQEYEDDTPLVGETCTISPLWSGPVDPED